MFLGEFPLATSDFQLPARNKNIGTSLEWSGESHSDVFNDTVRLRPCKVNKGLLISSHPTNFLIMFPSVRKTLVVYFFHKLFQGPGLEGRYGLSKVPPYKHEFAPNFISFVLNPIRGSTNIIPILKKDNEDGKLVVH